MKPRPTMGPKERAVHLYKAGARLCRIGGWRLDAQTWARNNGLSKRETAHVMRGFDAEEAKPAHQRSGRLG